MAGNLTIEQCGNVFAPVSRQASSNYGIGSDGRIGMYVEECNRSWCTSNAENDHRAITIEVANDGCDPDWHVSDKAMTSLINLCVDICKRNGIEKLNYTGDKSGNLTMHKWFAATGCPGPYLSSKFPYIAEQVNKELDKSSNDNTNTADNTPNSKYLNYDEFEKKYIGKGVDYDNIASRQCVDLADQYFEDCFGIKGVWVDGAKDFYNKFNNYPALVKNFNKIPNTRELVIEKGDVVIWGGGSWGHVAIGNGQGNIDWFVSLEENTLGRNEPTQLVKHYFANNVGNDGCSPVLGVLRPKDKDRIQGKTVTTTTNTTTSTTTTELKTLDSAGFKKGDKGYQALALKSLLKLAVDKKIVDGKMDDTSGIGNGCVKVINSLLGRWGYKQNGIAGTNFINKLYKELK
jgi:hypothetical protein